MIKPGGTPDWTKSTYTVQNACVEVRSTHPATMQITDSKFRWGRDGAPVMAVSPAAFTALVGMAARA
jgi:hypothetical protein